MNMSAGLLGWLSALMYYVIIVSAYNDVNENFSYDDLAKNRTGLKIYLDCFMSKGPCDDTAAHYKSHIMDAVSNSCRYCSLRHRHNARAFLTAIEKEFPEETKEFKKMYDTEGSHFKSMEDLVNRY